MLQNQHLRNILEEIDSCSDPQELLNRAMRIPIFKEFIDECLQILEHKANI